MALKPIDPRNDGGAERDRYERDLKHAAENPHRWANGEEHKPQVILSRRTIEEVIGRRDPDAASERLVAADGLTGPQPESDPNAGKSSRALGLEPDLPPPPPRKVVLSPKGRAIVAKAKKRAAKK